jgi:hypothetical protein
LRTGKLDRMINIERLVETIDAFVAQQAWVAVLRMRAQILHATTEDFTRNHGNASEGTVIFRHPLYRQHHPGAPLLGRLIPLAVVFLRASKEFSLVPWSSP